MEYGVRLTLAYDGTEFAGFARQPEARTVAGVVDAAIARITQHPVEVRGASRTDAGVHAEGQVVAFETRRSLTPERWLLAVNRYLPPDVAVRDAAACAPGYNPRFDAVDKTYRYLFYLGLGRHPLLRHRVWHLGRDVMRGRCAAPVPLPLPDLSAPLDLPAMRETAALLAGTHDFAAFRAADDARERTERTLHSVELASDFGGERHLLALQVRGNAFMKNMMRILAGTLIAVGRGRLTPGRVRELLEPGAVRSPLAETAPAQGLTLVNVTLGRTSAVPSR